MYSADIEKLDVFKQNNFFKQRIGITFISNTLTSTNHIGIDNSNEITIGSQRTHAGKSYTICPETSIRAVTINDHHLEVGKSLGNLAAGFQCSICPKVLKTKKSLSNHKSRMHRLPGNLPTRYDCPKCDRSYQTPYNLSRHKCV